jgi:hypothetical protein
MSEIEKGAGDAGLAFRAALLRELRPVGALQEVIAERIVIGMWRTLRGAPPERRPRRMRVVWVGMEDVWPAIEFDAVGSDAAVEAMSPAEVARYDASMARQLRRDLETLGQMQGRVIGSAAPPAAEGSPRSKSKPRP